MMKKIDARNCVVFFDFDNTIATCDVFDDMLLSLAKNNHWEALEEEWLKGKIGSRECLEGQLKCMSLAKRNLDAYLSRVKLDPYFKKLAAFLSGKKARVFILSDNFDYILKRILKNYGMRNLKVYANQLRLEDGKFVPRFPLANKKCPSCGHCKTKNLLANIKKNSIIFYIGDGRSDICPAYYADIVFAKDDLLRHFQKKRLPCRKYRTLKDIYTYARRNFR